MQRVLEPLLVSPTIASIATVKPQSNTRTCRGMEAHHAGSPQYSTHYVVPAFLCQRTEPSSEILDRYTSGSWIAAVEAVGSNHWNPRIRASFRGFGTVSSKVDNHSITDGDVVVVEEEILE